MQQKKQVVDGKLRCSRCGQWKEATTENFFVAKSHHTGFRVSCKKCEDSVDVVKIFRSEMAVAKEMLASADGMSFEEIGKELNISTQGAEQCAIRALCKLMKYAKRKKLKAVDYIG